MNLGDGYFSFEEFVEIVSNMGATAERTADQEEKELRDAFRVCFYIMFVILYTLQSV